MTLLKRSARTVVGVGEAMVEFAAVGDGFYRRGFAGDTLNACWHMAALLGDKARVAFLTRVGTDPDSSAFVEFVEQSGLDMSLIGRDATRAIGLYVISLSGAERSFTYWRDASAARLLADDRDAIDAAFDDAGLIYASGITLAVLGETGRRNLIAALAAARGKGSVVAFDPNARLRLWPDADAFRRASRAMLAVTDIALPSFDDEAQVWGDSDPEATAVRIGALGVREIAVKNGARPVTLSIDGVVVYAPTPPAAEVRDTTGAGDSFNAGYLAGRIAGMAPLEACALGQRVARAVIGHYGALAARQDLADSAQSVQHAMTNA